MFEPIPLHYQTLYSELAQRSLDAAFSSEFSNDGRFVTQESRGRRYWYFDQGSGPEKKRRYVGPVDDAAITERVENFKSLKSDLKARRKLVSTLTREAYLPRPDQKSGDVIEAVAEAGFFRLRGVLVGTVAFQCYAAVLSLRLPNTAMQTADADLAQFEAISRDVADSTGPIVERLKQIDPTFRRVPHQGDRARSTQLVARDGYRVDFLTPNVGSPDLDGRPTAMPALGDISAEPLRFLDFLIYQPERAVLLHNAGIAILVPTPERFAVHKLIVGSRRHADRNGLAKSNKDRLQASLLIEAMVQVRRGRALGDAFMDAWNRGPSWQTAITRSIEALSETDAGKVRVGLETALTQAGGRPNDYGLA